MNYKNFLTTGLLIVLMTGFSIESYAIPAFARKYRTSCTTCHIAYPKLNAYGEAFRLNGYVIPDMEEEFIKEEPLKLGSEAYKRVWPNSIWPTSIPGNPPIALAAEHGFNYEREGDIKSEFTQPTVNLFFAGSFDESISVYTGLHLFEEGEVGSLGRAFIRFNNILYDKLPAARLHFRMGQFIPEAVPFANHRNLSITSYALNSYYPELGAEFSGGHAHGGGTGFTLENNQLGAEFSGILKSRFRFAAGIVNGNGPNGESNTAKDGYFRIAFKKGGMAFDGTTGSESEGSAISTGDNWKEYSLRFGLFGYKGAKNNIADTGPNDLKFDRFGFDFNIMLSNLNIFGGFITGADRYFSDFDLIKTDYNSYFLEGFYPIYPWLISSIRYERVDTDLVSAFDRIVPNLTILTTANVKIALESSFIPGDISMSRFQYVFYYAF